MVRSLTKLIRIRGENCVEASVSVISSIAKTIDTTVMIEVAMLPRIAWATPGSSCEGKRTFGIQALIPGADSSKDESTAPAIPKATAMANGRMRKPPRSAYITAWIRTGRCSNIPKPVLAQAGLIVARVQHSLRSGKDPADTESPAPSARSNTSEQILRKCIRAPVFISPL